MATVYLAHDLRHERQVALKVLKPELAAIVGSDRFLGEIKTTANLQHPHILPLFDSGTADGFLYFVMPYAAGETLRERLDREGPLPEDEAVRITVDVAEALDYAHRQGVVHRDIKPSNILIQEGRPVVADFGIALAVGEASDGRITATGLSVGTPHYMSPEQAVGDEDIDARADQYSLGCLLYEMLVGEPPHTGKSSQAILASIITGGPVSARKKRPSVPASVDAALRKALSRDPGDRFASTIDFARALGDADFKHKDPIASRRLRQRVVAVVGAAAVVAALALGWSRDPDGGSPPEIDRSIAVLPFDDLSSEQDQAYFVRGLAEEILVTLTKIEDLKVSGRTSSFALKDRDLSVDEIGRQLGVAHVLDGSVRRAGSRVRVAVRLTETSSGFELWADGFEGELDDVFAIQDSIARAIADQLRITLVADDGASTSTLNQEAYEAYLRGRHFRGLSTEESLRQAIAEYERATALEPAYAEAWASLAEAWVLLHILWDGVDFRTAQTRALAHAQTAVRLDPDLVLGRTMLGYAWTEAGEWSRAEEELRQAVALGPSDAEAHKRLGNVLWISGRLDAGLRELDIALELDPVDRLTLYSRVWGRLAAGRYAEALADVDHLIELDPGWAKSWETRTGTLIYLGQHAEARASVDRWAELAGADVEMERAAVDAMIRFKETGVPQPLAYPLDNPSGPGRTLYVLIETGQVGPALRLMQGMLQAGAKVGVKRILMISDHGPLESDPRFRELLDAAGITL